MVAQGGDYTASQVGALGATAAAGGDLAGNYPAPTLAAIGSATGPIGDSTHVAAVTIDTKGRVTSLTSTAISFPASGVTSFNTRTGAVTSTSGDYSVGQVTGAAALASPTFTGTPAAPTATVGTNTTQLATTAFVQAALPTSLPPSGSMAGTSQAYPNPTLSGTTNVESIITANTTVAGALQKTGGTMSGAIAMGAHKVTGLSNGSASDRCRRLRSDPDRPAPQRLSRVET